MIHDQLETGQRLKKFGPDVIVKSVGDRSNFVFDEDWSDYWKETKGTGRVLLA